MRRLSKQSGKKLDGQIEKIVARQTALIAKELAQDFAEKNRLLEDNLNLKFDSLIAGIANSFSGGKLDTRKFANAAARFIAPAIGDLLNRSLSQQGDDLLASISKSQRNS